METLGLKRFDGYSLYVIFALAIITVLTIVAGVIVSIEDSEEESNSFDITVDNPVIFWEIEQVSPNQDNTQNFDIVVQSNAGVIQNFENLISYGISNNGQYLAIHTDSGIEIVTLSTEERAQVLFEGDSYVGDYGNAFTWSNDNNFFAFGAVNTNNLTDTRIWIVSRDGEISNFIELPLIVEQSDKIRVETVQFSPFNSFLLARAYSEDDFLELNENNEEYQLTELPVRLQVYNIEGTQLEDIQIRDFDTSGSQIYYGWDSLQPGYLEYGIFDSGEEVNPTNAAKITRVKVF